MESKKGQTQKQRVESDHQGLGLGGWGWNREKLIKGASLWLQDEQVLMSSVT